MLPLDETLLHRLPLPLAQLYRRGCNARSPFDRHQAAYYLWEASLKLLGCVAIVTYAERHTPDAKLAERLEKLARPSLGHWWEFVRGLLPVLAEDGDAAFVQLRDLLLGKTRDDLPRAAGLDAALIEHFEGASGARATVRLTELFDRLVRYRNQVAAGHGAVGLKEPAFYDRMSRALLAGVTELLGRLDPLAGRRLVYVAEVRRQPSRRWLVERYELVGETARLLEVLDLPESASPPDAEQVHLETGPAELRSLHPLVVYSAESGELAFLNSPRGRQRIEFLNYMSGDVFDREEWLGAQSVLLARLLKMPVDPGRVAQWQAAEAAEETPPEEAPAPASTRRIGEFELISELGRGGMGVVYRAWQPSLGRQVALKCLLSPGDHTADARFAREIRALGRVEHPHLVKIFTSGSDGERLFYAMELLEGATLAAVCDKLSARSSTAMELDLPTWKETVESVCSETRQAEKLLSDVPLDEQPPHHAALREQPPAGRDYVRQVVELMAQVAEAAHALHEAGVIHRDIKPGNILVNEDGTQAVLMDLGLAQLADQLQGRLTRTRQFIGTLRYASPEQVLAVAHLDRRSDVYSLGATLWELLSLRPMFNATEQTPQPEVMKRIQYEEPEGLRRYLPGRLGRDLEAVVQKCLEKDARKRYATACDLALELDCVLAGKPVAARPVSKPERWRRWCVRNPLAAGLLATIVLAAIGLAAGLVMVTQKNRELDAKNEDLQQANENLVEANQRTTAAKNVAEQRRQQANARYELALGAYKELVFGVQQKLQNRPGTSDLRRSLLAKAAEGLTKLAKNAEKTADADRTTAAALLQLGDVLLTIDGQLSKARDVFQKGHAILQRLADADPKDAQAQRDLSISYGNLGDLSLRAGDTQQAQRYYQDGLAICKRLADADPKDAQAQRDLSISYENLGDVSRQAGDTPQALRYYQDGLTIRKRLANADPKDAQAQRDLSISYERLGDVSRQAGDTQQALRYYQDDLAICKRLADADPKAAQAQRDLSISYERLGNMSRQAGDTQQALRYYQDDLAICKRLADADPKDAQAQRDLSVSYNKLGNVGLQAGDTQQALRYYQDDLAIAKRLAAADPKDAQAQRDLSISYNKLGDVSQQAGDTPQALRYYQDGLTIRKRLAEADAASFEALTDLVVSYYKIGKAAEQDLEFGQARGWFEKASMVLKNLEQPCKLKNTRFASWVKMLSDERAGCAKKLQAATDLAFALAQAKDEVPALLLARTRVLLRQGKLADAAVTAEKLAALEPLSQSNLYNAACGCALCAGAAKADASQAERYAARALELLGQAKAAGFFKTPAKIALLKRVKDLDPLRERADFKEFLAEIANPSPTK